MAPDTQTVMAISAAGGPDVLQPRRERVASPGDDEILIQVQAAGINRHDVNQRRRGPTPNHSDVPGLEVAGVVAGLGARVKGWSVGDPICALTDGGGYAQYATAPAGHCFAIPDGFGVIEAAALPEALFTIWHNFFNLAQLGPGESVLLHGGTSGVGTIAIQMLTHLGHPVYATCGSDEKTALAHALGAAKAFNYRRDSFEKGVADCTGGRGVDVILDMSGGRYAARNLEALARRGRLVHLSPGDGADFTAPLRMIMAKEAKITGSLLRPLPVEEKSLIAQKLRAVIWPILSQGQIKPVIREVFALTKAASAHAAMEDADHSGKLILNCAEPL
jgi:putative PIG3 family NAD(P)H quinone oxidoreductase